jgi:hypothetical protein
VIRKRLAQIAAVLNSGRNIRQDITRVGTPIERPGNSRGAKLTLILTGKTIGFLFGTIRLFGQ